jgi:hypothetical protein
MTRQYTFTCEQDYIDIKEGFCPRYAVFWLEEQNRPHWPEGTVIRHRPEYLLWKDLGEYVLSSSSLSGNKYLKSIKSHALSSSIKKKKNINIKELGKKMDDEKEIPLFPHKMVRFDLFREIIPIIDTETVFEEIDIFEDEDNEIYLC